MELHNQTAAVSDSVAVIFAGVLMSKVRSVEEGLSLLDRFARELAHYENEINNIYYYGLDYKTAPCQIIKSLIPKADSISEAKSVVDWMAANGFGLRNDVFDEFVSLARNYSECIQVIAITEEYDYRPTAEAFRRFLSPGVTVEEGFSLIDMMAKYDLQDNKEIKKAMARKLTREEDCERFILRFGALNAQMPAEVRFSIVNDFGCFSSAFRVMREMEAENRWVKAGLYSALASNARACGEIRRLLTFASADGIPINERIWSGYFRTLRDFSGMHRVLQMMIKRGLSPTKVMLRRLSEAANNDEERGLAAKIEADQIMLEGADILRPS